MAEVVCDNQPMPEFLILRSSQSDPQLNPFSSSVQGRRSRTDKSRRASYKRTAYEEHQKEPRTYEK